MSDGQGNLPPEGFFRSVFEGAQHEAQRHDANSPGLDWRPIIVLITVAVCLTLQSYVFGARNLHVVLGFFERTFPTQAKWFLDEWIPAAQDRHLAALIYWAIGTYITYVLIPALVVKFILRAHLRDFGVKFRGMFRGGWLYLVMFVCMAGPIWFFSGTDRFQESYPFYRLNPEETLWPRFLIWEAFYVAQFFALEFFFRGFLLHGLRPRLGFYAIFVMMVPYCMIHFAKPMPETFGAIGAGVILGFMSLKTRSIWLGAALHVAVAISMDLLALERIGLLRFS